MYACGVWRRADGNIRWYCAGLGWAPAHRRLPPLQKAGQPPIMYLSSMDRVLVAVAAVLTVVALVGVLVYECSARRRLRRFDAAASSSRWSAILFRHQRKAQLPWSIRVRFPGLMRRSVAPGFGVQLIRHLA
jgi:hypothetical protein